MAIKKVTEADIIAVDTIQKAKDYQINGKPLENSEKNIFDNDLLKKKKADGTLDNDPDLNELKETLVFLINYKAGKEKVKTETMGLKPEGQALLNALLVAQKGNSIAYQLVNGIGNDKPIDKVISQFEDVLFAESEPEFNREIEEKSAELGKIQREEYDVK